MPLPNTQPTATWNPAAGAWQTPTLGLCGHSEPFSATWPSSGSMRAGAVYARPTSAPPTAGSASSSSPGLVPTPLAADAGVRGGTSGWGLRDFVAQLLPTPCARDGIRVAQPHDVSVRRARGAGPMLDEAVASLLPTPRATDGTKGGPNQRGSSGDLMLPSAVLLLPTPTATPYGSNQSASSGAVSVRPSLDTLAPMLLPTPTATDSKSSSGSNPAWGHGVTLTDAARSIGAPTTSPSEDGNAA